MTLEDFFTLTEMKGGLTTPARVEELVAVMQEERDSLVKNVGDATRQWSTVGSVISATDNKDCLDLFIQLDGLWFIDRWLKDAQTVSAAASDCFVEESISALLKALERLKIDGEKLKSSGICITVKALLGHQNSGIQDKVRALLESWKTSDVNEAVKVDSEEVQPVHDDRMESGSKLAGESGTSKCSAADTPLSKANSDHHGSHALLGDDAASSGCCGEQQSEEVEPVSKPDKFANSNRESDHKDVENVPVSPVKLEPDKVESLVEGEGHPSEGKLGSQNSLDSEHDTDVRKESSTLELSADVVNAKIPSESLSKKLGKVVVTAVSDISKSVDVFSTAVKEDDPESVGKAVARADKDVDSSTVKTMTADEHPPTGESSIGVDDTGVLKNCTVTLDHRTSAQVDEGHTNSLQGSPGNAIVSGKPVDLEEICSQNDNLRSAKKVRKHAKDESSHFRNSRERVRRRRGSKHANVISKTSAMDLEYGTVDALEVARLVAMEVERQVAEDDDENFGSSSERSSRSDTRNSVGCPGSLDGKDDEEGEGPMNELPTVENMPAEGSHKEDEPSVSSDNVNAEPENVMQDINSSQVTEAAPAQDVNAEKGACVIDLNLEVCSGDADDAANSVSNPVSIVSASRAVAAPGLPASPLKFEGSLGWKGSAATSAFRPASPRKFSDGDRNVSVGGATFGSGQKQDFLIDLNVAEDGDDKAVNIVSDKPNLMIPGLTSGKSSVELSPRRSEKLKFDLNQMTEDGDVTPSVWKPFGPKIVRHSPSPASSSSSMKPSMRNFDLNDNPSNYNDPSEPQPYLGMFPSHKANAYGGSSDESVVTIMGAKVKKSPSLHQTPIPFLNSGRASEHVVDPNSARGGTLLGAGSAVQYNPSPVYGYNGIAVGPTIPFSSPMYGPGGSVAYMVDSRGVSLVPQLIGTPPSTVQAPFAHQPSFPANMMGPLPGPNGAGPSRSNLDLNSGFITEGVNRDPGGFRQLFIPAQVRSGEEHLQPLFPGMVGGKRKEPDGGWEPYLTNYKHHQPPHL